MLTRVRRSKAFTLVELLIVILLIAILMAIAIPNFLGSRQKAGDRAAQQNLRTAVSTVKAYASDFEDFQSLGTDAATKLGTAEPNIRWTDNTAKQSANSNVREVGVAVSTDSKDFFLTAEGSDGVCWYVKLSMTAADEYGVNKAASCDATGFPTADAKTEKGEFPSRENA